MNIKTTLASIVVTFAAIAGAFGQEQAPRPQIPQGWSEQWDEAVGLWARSSGGHTHEVADLDRVHSARTAARRLLYAAHVDRIDQIEVAAILKALRTMQTTDEGPRHGCFRWYWEESRPIDTNASFFVGLNLLVLQLAYPDRLESPHHKMLQRIFHDLTDWFDSEIADPSPYYPNKYLGDLVCRWLILEATDETGDMERVQEAMLEAATYWQDKEWGWGEHMSNTYAGVMLNELSLLLVLSEQLPQNVRAAYKDLRDELLAIEDAFGNGPRVPMIRGYSFLHAPDVRNYRDRVKPLQGAGGGADATYGAILHNLGWHDEVPGRAPLQEKIEIRCFGGVKAMAKIEGGARLGTLSRFPLMPEMEHRTWGLSWQSFPMALWLGDHGWGYLQWKAKKDGETRAHPAEKKSQAYLHNALSWDRKPPIFGWTYSRQRAGNAVVLRVMPKLDERWDGVIDRFRVVDADIETEVNDNGEGRSRLSLKTPKQTVLAHHIRLNGPSPKLAQSGSTLDWAVHFNETSLKQRSRVINLWAFQLNGEDAVAPVIKTLSDGESWELEWDVGRSAEPWRLRLDPEADQPLTTISD